MQEQQPKICKQCKYWSYEQSTNVCKHGLSKVSGGDVDKETGYVLKPVYRYCFYMRDYSNCGEEGVLFEPKTSLSKDFVDLLKVTGNEN